MWHHLASIQAHNYICKLWPDVRARARARNWSRCCCHCQDNWICQPTQMQAWFNWCIQWESGHGTCRSFEAWGAWNVGHVQQQQQQQVEAPQLPQLQPRQSSLSFVIIVARPSVSPYPFKNNCFLFICQQLAPTETSIYTAQDVLVTWRCLLFNLKTINCGKSTHISIYRETRGPHQPVLSHFTSFSVLQVNS